MEENNIEKAEEISYLRSRRERVKNFFYKVVSGAGITIMILGGGWLEFGGIYHSFKNVNTTDGLISVFVPPYAWYRSITFFPWTKERKQVQDYLVELFIVAKKTRPVIDNLSKEEILTIIPNVQRDYVREVESIPLPKRKELLRLHENLLRIHRDTLARYEKIELGKTDLAAEKLLVVYKESSQEVLEKLYPILEKYKLGANIPGIGAL